MFSFHKPKIYRSISGCCICRAKSSSSRFTDSKRYETDFAQCFRVHDCARAGEICNACVLLVKRWKKLPLGSIRNWNHVVDARAGPGTRSINKMKMKCKEEKVLKKHKHRRRALPEKPPQSPGGLSDDVVMGDDYLSDEPIPAYLSASDGSDDERQTSRKVAAAAARPPRKLRRPSKSLHISSFLDLTYWKQTVVCCGTIFKGANGEVLVDTSLLHPCRSCKPASRCVSPLTATTTAAVLPPPTLTPALTSPVVSASPSALTSAASPPSLTLAVAPPTSIPALASQPPADSPPTLTPVVMPTGRSTPSQPRDDALIGGDMAVTAQRGATELGGAAAATTKTTATTTVLDLSLPSLSLLQAAATRCIMMEV